MDGRGIRTHDQRPMILPTTPFAKALVRWAVDIRLTNRFRTQTKPYNMLSHCLTSLPCSFLVVRCVATSSSYYYHIIIHCCYGTAFL